ncbi:30S ribosome-binding factor RbfA [Fodinisporobacter ferrooxydans]|uniref:Ribosome-binding factor A n=1 Tax=Fodinisporobacter ferrooxydans TaxID=2901836 RepID=A0ABY4CGA2_9BACL|nr:30S ribosome-binding factor RbfA [Alicyclobacillaceae bacterium MYW30-H2]
MAKVRVSRVGEQIKKEINDIVRYELKDPRIGFLTITDVEVSGDLSYAKVFISVLGKEEERDHTLQALVRASGFIRSELGKRLRIRHTPELSFSLDRSLDYSERIHDVLRSLDTE